MRREDGGMRNHKNQTVSVGYAFWSYDLFPHLLGGEFSTIEDDSVYVPSYQGWVQPKFILGLEAGKALRKKLETLTTEYRSKNDEVYQEFSKKVDGALAECGQDRRKKK
jgi:hypothetical protein